MTQFHNAREIPESPVWSSVPADATCKAPESGLIKTVFKLQSFHKRHHIGGQNCGLRI